jgi:hypothetical protein
MDDFQSRKLLEELKELINGDILIYLEDTELPPDDMFALKLDLVQIVTDRIEGMQEYG